MNTSALSVHPATNTALPASSSNCIDCPDYDCADNPANGLFRLDIFLKGPLDRPPYMARLYCKNQMLGRLLIKLNRVIRSNDIKLSGKINVRYGDILEWNSGGIRGLGFISENGMLKRLDMLETSIDFRKALIEYLRTRRIDCITPYLLDAPAKSREMNNSKINHAPCHALRVVRVER